MLRLRHADHGPIAVCLLPSAGVCVAYWAQSLANVWCALLWRCQHALGKLADARAVGTRRGPYRRALPCQEATEREAAIAESHVGLQRASAAQGPASPG